MTTYQTALELVQDQINKPDPYWLEQSENVIVEDETIVKEYGWVFFYQSKMYLETGDMSFALAGNAPIIVNKHDGSLHVTGTAHPIEYFIEQYERKLSNNGHLQ